MVCGSFFQFVAGRVDQGGGNILVHEEKQGEAEAEQNRPAPPHRRQTLQPFCDFNRHFAQFCVGETRQFDRLNRSINPSVPVLARW